MLFLPEYCNFKDVCKFTRDHWCCLEGHITVECADALFADLIAQWLTSRSTQYHRHLTGVSWIPQTQADYQLLPAAVFFVEDCLHLFTVFGAKNWSYGCTMNLTYSQSLSLYSLVSLNSRKMHFFKFFCSELIVSLYLKLICILFVFVFCIFISYCLSVYIPVLFLDLHIL